MLAASRSVERVARELEREAGEEFFVRNHCDTGGVSSAARDERQRGDAHGDQAPNTNLFLRDAWKALAMPLPPNGV